nr:hypothetical protein B0A51_03388 [Rachicladosporium sp. CCFEE 5018]
MPDFKLQLHAYLVLTLFITAHHLTTHAAATGSQARIHISTHPVTMSSRVATAARYFRITLLRSAIGLPSNNLRILKSLGLHRRLRTVYHPVSPDVAGKIFAVKELVDVSEVDQKLSPEDMRELRRPERGYWVEKRAAEVLGS